MHARATAIGGFEQHRPRFGQDLDAELLGDVVVTIDRQPVTVVDDLLSILEHYQPGASVPVELSRNGQRRTINLRLVEAP